MASTVPVTKDFDEIYAEDARSEQRTRWNKLLATFEKEYGHKADFVSRSPGRVNIIGEHIDYSLYEVLPMAITEDMLLAVSIDQGASSGSTLHIANINPQKYAASSVDLSSGTVEIDPKAHDWSNYFKAGVKGATELLKERQGAAPKIPSMNVLSDGTVPAGGGLSSSAAFVCASALAVLRAEGQEHVEKGELTEASIVSERAVGVNSGGMDQAASVFAQRDSALFVSFVPKLTAQTLMIPKTNPPFVFVVAQSLVVSDKAVTAPIHYNLRVVECTLATLCLAKIFRVQQRLAGVHDASPLGICLRSFHEAYFAEHASEATGRDFQQQLARLEELVDDYLPQEEGYSRDEISAILGVPVAQLEERFMSQVPVRAERFKLRQRAAHVFGEARRVLEFRQLLDAPPAGDLPQKLGALMNQTQESCRDVYENSCAEIDQLCEIAIGHGSLGSRLTGAGWGGCTVHLVPESKVEAVTGAWRREYYDKKHPGMSEEQLAQAIVVSKPGSGSTVWLAEGRAEV